MLPPDLQHVSRETSGKLQTYAGLITRWTQKINLIAPDTIPEVMERHILNSVWVSENAPPARSWIDVGSGAGLPGIVVAILRPQVRVTCIEKDRRKCEFLRTVRRELKLDFDIHSTRAQDIVNLTADVVSARGLAPLHRLFDLLHPLTGPCTTLVLPKGKTWREEVDAVGDSWTYELDVVEDPENIGSALLNVTKLARR